MGLDQQVMASKIVAHRDMFRIEIPKKQPHKIHRIIDYSQCTNEPVCEPSPRCKPFWNNKAFLDTHIVSLRLKQAKCSETHQKAIRTAKEREWVHTLGTAMKAMAAQYKGATLFDGKSVPKLDLVSFLTRIVDAMNQHDIEESCPNVYRGTHSLGFRILASAIVYIDRIIGASSDLCAITELNVHRIVAISMMACSKFAEDSPLNNEFWAQITGLKLAHLNDLERKFVLLIDFKLSITSAEFDRILALFTLNSALL